MPPPTFYFALGARPRPRDCLVAMLAGQRHFLAPAGSPADQLLQHTPGVHIVLDSWAYPPCNPLRPSLARYAHLVAGWHARTRFAAEVGQIDAPWFDWAISYDTIGDAAASEHDDALVRRLCQHLCRTSDPPIVPVIHYPHASASTIIDGIERPVPSAVADKSDGAPDRPAWAIGGLVVAHYNRASQRWYEQLIADLEAASTVHPSQHRIHLLGVGRPDWVLASPLVISFDSSGPARLAVIGFASGIGRAYSDAYGLSVEKLCRSREARLAYHIAKYRSRVGLPWQRVDTAALLDDREVALLPASSAEHWEQAALM